jgi:hypothetical protein
MIIHKISLPVNLDHCLVMKINVSGHLQRKNGIKLPNFNIICSDSVTNPHNLLTEEISVLGITGQKR